MRKNRLSPEDVDALLNGTAPAGRAELELVAAFVEDLRLASSESAPRPSAALSARLDSASWISPAVGGLPPAPDREAVSAFAAPLPHRGRVRMIFSWFTGLGLITKIAIGAGVLAVGAVGAGAANALPTPVQQGFDEIVQTLTPGEETPTVHRSGTDATDTDTDATDTDVADDGAAVPDPTVEDGTTTDGTAPVVGDDDGTADQGKTDHAAGVTEAAHDDSTEGSEHGQAVSDAAHQNRGQGSDDGADHESGDDDATGEVETGDDNGGNDASGDRGSNKGSGSSNSGSSGSGSGSGSNSGSGNSGKGKD